MTGLSKKKRRELRRQSLIGEQRESGLRLQFIEPKTCNQRTTFEEYDDGRHLLLHGMAGTGKTFISMYLALSEILEDQSSQYRTLKIVRSAVPTRNVGFLPGKEQDKIEVYELPYRSICTELFGRGDAYEILKFRGDVEFISTSFVRGTTFNDCIILVDEVNNMSFHELDSILTRLGDNCRVIFCGDFRQSDLGRYEDRGGLRDFMKIIDNVRNFSHVEFDEDDIVRSDIVKDYIIARERLGIRA